MTRRSWLHQIVTIQGKGYAAFEAGVPLTENPYGNTSVGGSVQRQRRQAWRTGWKLAQREKKENEQ